MRSMHQPPAVDVAEPGDRLPEVLPVLVRRLLGTETRGATPAPPGVDAWLGDLTARGALRQRQVHTVDELTAVAERLICVTPQGRAALVEVVADGTCRLDLGTAGPARTVGRGALDALLPCRVLYAPRDRTPPGYREPGAWVGVCLRFGAQVLGLAMPIAMMLIIDKVVSHGAANTLGALLFGVALLTALQYLFLWAHVEHSLRGTELGAHESRCRVLDALLGCRAASRWAAFGWDAMQTAQESARHRVEIAPQCVADCLYAALLALLMAAFDPALLALSVAFVPAYLGADLWSGRRMRRALEGTVQRRGRLATRYFESLSAADEIHLANLTRHTAGRWRDDDATLAVATCRAGRCRRLGVLAVEFLQRLSVLAIALFGVRSVIAGDMTLGQYVAFNLLSLQFAQPLLRVAAFRRAQDEERQRSSARKAIVERGGAEPWAAAGRRVLSPRGGRALQVRGLVTVAGHGRAVSLAVPAGGWAGIHGPSGCGKTSLLRCLAGLDEPLRGEVRLDGVALIHLDYVVRSRIVRMVPQHPSILSTSMAENIRMGDPGAADAWVAAVAGCCGLLDLAERLPAHLDTVVGPAGHALSGGERQRLAIARAVLARPGLLLLDEATSSLDAAGECTVLANLRRLLPDATVVIVAHRQAPLALCGQILRLEPVPGPVALKAAGGAGG